MLAYRCLITLLTLCALLGTGAAQTKIPPPAVPTVPAPPGMEGPVRPETVGALEAQLPPHFPEITEPLRKQLLDNSYRFVLTKLFWLRDAHTISWTVVQDALAWEVWIFVPSPRERFVIAPRSDGAPVTSTAVRLQRLTQKV